MGIYQKTLGYMVTDASLNKITVTRQHLSFDPQLFPLRLKPDAPPLFKNYHKLTTPTLPTPDSTPQMHPSPFEEQDSSDFEPDDKAPAETPTTEPKETHKRKRTEDESESSESDSDIVTTSMSSLRPRTTKPLVTKPTKHTPRYDTDEEFRNERNSMIGKRITKYFPGHGAFKGTVQEYAIKTDNYLVVYDVEPNSWREMRKSTHAAKLQIACDEEMESLRKLNCWPVVPPNSVPPGTPIMGSRWTFKAKTDQHGEITRLRVRFVCQEFSQACDSRKSRTSSTGSPSHRWSPSPPSDSLSPSQHCLIGTLYTTTYLLPLSQRRSTLLRLLYTADRLKTTNLAQRTYTYLNAIYTA